MMLTKINGRLMKVGILIVLAISITLNIYNHYQNTKLNKKYESLLCLSNQFYQTSLITFLASEHEADTSIRTVEIFDIKKGEVIKRVSPNPTIEKTAISYLKAISGMYAAVKAFPDNGYIIRIPVVPPIEVQNPWLNDYNIYSVNQIFILLPQQGNPYLLVLDNRLRPYFYYFDGDIDKLLKDLEFYPVPSQQ
jgi:hypothetical protein